MSYKDLKPGHKYRTTWNDRPGESSARDIAKALIHGNYISIVTA